MRITPPVQFVAMVLVLWTAGRIAVRSPETLFGVAVGGNLAALAGTVPKAPRVSSRAEDHLRVSPRPVFQWRPSAGHFWRPIRLSRRRAATHATVVLDDHRLMIERREAVATPSVARPVYLAASDNVLRPVATSEYQPRPLAISAWLFLREGNGRPALAGIGQLGGSQAGIRATYRIAEARGAVAALSARLSRPIEGANGAEAAFGIAVRPARAVPVEVAFERRVALERGARDAWTIGAAGGVDRLPLPLDLELDAYAQAGIVGARSRDLYIDGAAAVQRQIAGWGRTTLQVGAGVWGGAQPGASRFDAGPRATLRFPAQTANVRISLDWRQRVAGNAEPDSGLALTIGTDF